VLRALLRWAVLAPSRHNAQPWIFEIEGDALRLYADGARALPAVDPDGRELLLGCGAALANLQLAAEHFGFSTPVERVPGYRHDGLLARVCLEERRVETPAGEALFQAIPHRRTHRLPLDGRDPPPGLVAALARDARREGVLLRPVEEHQRPVVAELVAEGDEVQWSDARFREELAAWTRVAPGGRDGMPAAARGLSAVAALAQPWLLRWWKDPVREQALRDRRRAVASRALLVLSTSGDGKEDRLHAGEALERLLLRVAAAGLTASYLNSPIEVPALRQRLREAIGETGIPQVMIRLGYGLVLPATPRRPVEQVVRRIEARPRRSEALARPWRAPAVEERAAPAGGLEGREGPPTARSSPSEGFVLTS
jgi:hypothetical protein